MSDRRSNLLKGKDLNLILTWVVRLILLALIFLPIYIFLLKGRVHIRSVDNSPEDFESRNFQVITVASEAGFVTEDDFRLLNDKSVVFFYSTWCGPCDYLRDIFRGQSEIYPQINFYEVDLDLNRDLANELDVQLTPSIVFVDEINLTTKTDIDAQSIPDYLNFFSTGGTFNL